MKYRNLSSFLLLLLMILVLQTHAQKLKNKEVKKLMESGKVSSISIVSVDKFTPGQNQVFDLSITLSDGQTILASDYHFIWEEVTINALNAGAKARGELLTKGNGMLVPEGLPFYYQVDSIVLSLELAGKKSSKVLITDYCFSNYIFSRAGSAGSSGTSGPNGGYDGGNGASGYPASAGSKGPDFTIKVDEEIIAGKPFLIMTFEGNKYRLDPECSSLTIKTIGGKGGDGGRGGNGAEGKKYEINLLAMEVGEAAEDKVVLGGEVEILPFREALFRSIKPN